MWCSYSNYWKLEYTCHSLHLMSIALYILDKTVNLKENLNSLNKRQMCIQMWIKATKFVQASSYVSINWMRNFETMKCFHFIQEFFLSYQTCFRLKIAYFFWMYANVSRTSNKHSCLQLFFFCKISARRIKKGAKEKTNCWYKCISVKEKVKSSIARLDGMLVVSHTFIVIELFEVCRWISPNGWKNIYNFQSRKH